MAKRRTQRANTSKRKAKVAPIVTPVVEDVVLSNEVVIRAPDNFEKTVIALATFFENVGNYLYTLLTKK